MKVVGGIRRLATMIFVGYFAISCNSDDPAPQDLATYTLEVNQEAWLFASDDDGKLLDGKQLVFGEPVTLSAPNAPETFSLTLVRRLSPNVAVLDVTTYAGIAPGVVIAPEIYQPVDGNNLVSSGKSTVRVTNYPLAQELPLVVSDPWQSITYNSSGQSTPTFSMNVWQSQQRKFIFSGYKDDLTHPVYVFADPVDVDATLSADFATFTPFEKTIDLKGFDTPLQGKVQFQLYSYSADQPSNGYKMANLEWYYNGTSPTVKVGYLDDFATYYMNLWVYEIDRQSASLKKSLNYTHIGPVTQSIKFLDDDLTVNDKRFGSFDFTFTGEYHVKAQRYTSFSNFASIGWTIYSGPNDKATVIEIPSKLAAKYPDIGPSDMTYYESSFYTFDDGFDYKKLVEEKFKTSFGPDHPCYVQTFPK